MFDQMAWNRAVEQYLHDQAKALRFDLIEPVPPKMEDYE